MPETSIKKKAANGLIWTTIQRFASMGIQFVSGIILARLLSPSDYGCIGMLAIFMTISSTFIDGGFGSALIQKKRPTNEDYSTIFLWNLGVSVAVYFILYASAPAISRFYRIDLLCPVLRVQGMVLIINAVATVQKNQLTKQFCFKKIAIVTIVTSLIALGVTIWMAYKGYGVWALVAQNLITAAIPAIVFWCTSHWSPSFVFSKQSFKDLFGFGGFMLLTHLINNIANEIQGLLIGRLYNASTLGYYSKARNTEKLSSNTISEALKQVTLPLYSEFQDDRKGLADVIKKLTGVVSFLTFPLMFLLILLAKPVFILLYSEKWMESVPYFQFLCLAGIAGCLQSVNLQAIAAIGKSKQMFSWTVVKRVVGISMVVVGLLLFGIWGLLTGVVLQTWFMYSINVYLVSKHVGYKAGSQLLDLLPALLLSIVAFGVSYMCGKVIPLGMYPNAAVELLLFCAIYMIGARIMNLRSRKDVLNIMQSVLGKVRKNVSQS